MQNVLLVMRKKKWECFGEIRCDINNEQNLKGFGMSTSGTENAREERDKAQDIRTSPSFISSRLGPLLSRQQKSIHTIL